MSNERAEDEPETVIWEVSRDGEAIDRFEGPTDMASQAWSLPYMTGDTYGDIRLRLRHVPRKMGG